MDAFWWQLPGPARYVASAVEHLRNGRNVVLRFPMHSERGFRDALEQKIRANDLWRWRPVNACELSADSPVSIAAALHDRLGYQPANGCLPGPAALAGVMPDGDIVWIYNLDRDRWAAWAGFLSQYQHACHAREEDRRGLFCTGIVGELGKEPVADTALAVLSWNKSVTRLDVMVYLDRYLPAEFPSPILRLVALSVATELGGADAELGACLAKLGQELLIDPMPTLVAHAERRGWPADNARRPSGNVIADEQLDGEKRVNTAVLASAGRRDDVRRRIWKGQVRILYPFIEEQRVRLVPEFERLLTFPLQTTFGTAETAIDLEIGQLVHFLLPNRHRIPDSRWRQLIALKTMRHGLAHLTPVEAEQFRSREFLELDSLA